jgi:hypothetical protein
MESIGGSSFNQASNRPTRQPTPTNANQTIRPDLLFLELDPARAGLMYR